MKNILFGFILGALVVTSVVQVAASSHVFPDVEANSWYEDAVYNLRDIGVIAGYPNGTYGPARNINRAEAATMLDSYKDFAVKQFRAFPQVEAPAQGEIEYLVCEEPDTELRIYQERACGPANNCWANFYNADGELIEEIANFGPLEPVAAPQTQVRNCIHTTFEYFDKYIELNVQPVPTN
ncbi:hypothetical protein COV82_02480 [Candidatus Peregrinibacteria bacterium CG11_big_fil_rev_8_21_14_0_20_46_8]|nr:MAG: hypothetical protein COV82_02480 [Candidatus Peregrinibacteria bacterium CG11_big_fil_rev_8_21_14_0_20_46_8]